MALNFLLDLILPKLCFGCQRPGTYLCSSCYHSIILTTIPVCPLCEKPSPFGYTHPGCQKRRTINGMYVLGDYQGILRKMIHSLKYKNVSSLANTLVNLWLKYYPSGIPNFDLIIPIPLHPKRYKERGFNQAEILGRLLAQQKKVIFSNQVIIRQTNTVSQMSLRDQKKRRENMKNAFICTGKININNKTVCIVDDVATTGATIFEAARVLKLNEAKSVWGIVLARNIPFKVAFPHTAR